MSTTEADGVVLPLQPVTICDQCGTVMACRACGDSLPYIDDYVRGMEEIEVRAAQCDTDREGHEGQSDTYASGFYFALGYALGFCRRCVATGRMRQARQRDRA